MVLSLAPSSVISWLPLERNYLTRRQNSSLQVNTFKGTVHFIHTIHFKHLSEIPFFSLKLTVFNCGFSVKRFYAAVIRKEFDRIIFILEIDRETTISSSLLLDKGLKGIFMNRTRNSLIWESFEMTSRAGIL